MIEIVDFYPNPRNKKKSNMLGTAHIFLTEDNIDVRGCTVMIHGKRPVIFMPTSVQIDAETNEPIRFSVLSFLDDGKQKRIQAAIAQEAIPFFKEWILENRDKAELEAVKKLIKAINAWEEKRARR